MTHLATRPHKADDTGKAVSLYLIKSDKIKQVSLEMHEPWASVPELISIPSVWQKELHQKLPLSTWNTLKYTDFIKGRLILTQGVNLESMK